MGEGKKAFEERGRCSPGGMHQPYSKTREKKQQPTEEGEKKKEGEYVGEGIENSKAYPKNPWNKPKKKISNIQQTDRHMGGC